jgi:hypothetical protein
MTSRFKVSVPLLRLLELVGQRLNSLRDLPNVDAVVYGFDQAYVALIKAECVIFIIQQGWVLLMDGRFVLANRREDVAKGVGDEAVQLRNGKFLNQGSLLAQVELRFKCFILTTKRHE